MKMKIKDNKENEITTDFIGYKQLEICCAIIVKTAAKIFFIYTEYLQNKLNKCF